ncbi:MAG TPA: PDZ domain-containing protein, partial [Pedobacter sp.]|nr:PDZ domain-containing protein [Pedobacter sp.]
VALILSSVIAGAAGQDRASKNLQTRLYVSLAGNDRNNGSLAKPFKSINRALEAAGEIADADVNIAIRGGKYYLDTTILIRSAETTVRSLRISSYAKENVFISAGRKLQLNWTVAGKGLFKARVPANISFERLYINGVLQQMARYPNYDPKARIFNGTSADAIAPERVKKWKDPKGGYVHALHSGEWGSWDYLITGSDQNGNLKLEGGWQNNRPSEMHSQHRFVENIREELDHPAEWFLDKQANILYYFPATGVRIHTATVEVSHLKNSIELKGSAERPVRNIEISGLNFLHNERSFMETREPLLRSDWTIYRGGAILFDGTENCKITDCSFTGLGGNAMMLSNYNVRDSISGCYVANIGASAVCFVGNRSAVRSALNNYNASLSYDQIDKIAGPLNNDYPQECVVTDNLFHNLGEVEKQATGVQIAMSSGIVASHNTIYNTPRAGINIGDGCWGGHEIAFNEVFNTVLETGDHGAFNSWGRDRFWHPNRKYMDSIVLAHPELILLDAQQQTTIHDNRFRCDHGWDIDLDDGSSNYRIYNNVCLNGGLKLREGFQRVVENNIIINNSFHPHVWFLNSGDVFKHNVVTKKYEPIGITDWGKEIDSNFFLDAAALANAKSFGNDLGSISGNPLFADQAKGNYAVAVNSPVFNIGFRSISMRRFGVKKAALKKMASQPLIAPLVQEQNLADPSVLVPFLGGQIKSVDGLGERSVYGLPDTNGAIVANAAEHSLLTQSGLQAKDVIRSADGKPVFKVQDLLNIYNAQFGRSVMTIEFMRNQKVLKTELKLK